MRPYYGHPPACTCAACTGGRPSSRGDSGDGDWRVIDCPTCEGTGKIYAGWSNPDQGRVARCPRCLGKGKIRQRRSTPRSRREPPPERTGRPADDTARESSKEPPQERRQPPPSRPARPRRPAWEEALEDAAAAPNPHAAPRQPPPARPDPPRRPTFDMVRPGSGGPPPRTPRRYRPRGRGGRGGRAWIVLLIVAAIVAAVFVGISPDIQSEIAEFLEGFRASEGGEPPPPAVAAPPSPTATPVPASPTPLPPFEWATVVTPGSRALESGELPATGYFAGWFGELGEDELVYNGRSYTVLEILYRESEGEVSVGLDSCLAPTALYALRIGPTELRWPISEQSESECVSTKSRQQRFRFTADEPVLTGEVPVTVTLILVPEGMAATGMATTTPQPTPTHTSAPASRTAHTRIGICMDRSLCIPTRTSMTSQSKL